MSLQLLSLLKYDEDEQESDDEGDEELLLYQSVRLNPPMLEAVPPVSLELA
jgi:hypothetical protein